MSFSGCQLAAMPACRKAIAAAGSLNFTAACPQVAANSKSGVTNFGMRRMHWVAGSTQSSLSSK
jgi:hypothetical protein